MWAIAGLYKYYKVSFIYSILRTLYHTAYDCNLNIGIQVRRYAFTLLDSIPAVISGAGILLPAVYLSTYYQLLIDR